ncbi:MAG: glycosyltransferase family 2 protein [Paludibacteraceae bacterium]|nr:glycosyltransferase family 2 protein [Paludibacteraceae bacterium]
MFDISASIVLYQNNSEELIRTIHSFLNTKMNVKLFLVDNSPTDRLKSIITDSRVEYLFINKNIGFGAAHNRILKNINNKSYYHLILNPDIYFNEGVLEGLFSFMIKNGDIGLVMPKICFPNGENQFLCKLLPNPIDLIFRKFFFSKKITEKLTRKYQLYDADYTKQMDVPSLSGCFMLVRSSVLNKVGCFDERFFMYCEDLDFSRRINATFRTVYYPNVTVYHEFHRDSYNNKKLLLVHICSAVKYFNKWGWFIDRQRNNVNKDTLSKLF